MAPLGTANEPRNAAGAQDQPVIVLSCRRRRTICRNAWMQQQRCTWRDNVEFEATSDVHFTDMFNVGLERSFMIDEAMKGESSGVERLGTRQMAVRRQMLLFCLPAVTTLTAAAQRERQRETQRVDEEEAYGIFMGVPYAVARIATENGPIDPSGRSGDRNVPSVITYNLRKSVWRQEKKKSSHSHACLATTRERKNERKLRKESERRKKTEEEIRSVSGMEGFDPPSKRILSGRKIEREVEEEKELRAEEIVAPCVTQRRTDLIKLGRPRGQKKMDRGAEGLVSRFHIPDRQKSTWRIKPENPVIRVYIST
ncbi:hypothetical protein WH47_04300 [Habropoda laboriosa]|uniref:Uncharacterized protein n=1 Tax=Habropoda laboriosa TaxID=597456 RepID=A0A0L7QQX8_9HYME|nr:hypothetical protein WH47_04300 [Habropoda laboriosa]